MLIHLITICIGLIIASGLFQLVELFRRRRIRAAQNAAQAKEDSAQSPNPKP